MSAAAEDGTPVHVEFETLAAGYGLAEAPRWAPDGGLYFSDVSEGGVFRRDPSGRVGLVIPRRRRVGGIALHARGGIVVSGRDVSHVHGGASRTLFAREGTIFNDFICDVAGRIYVGAVRSQPQNDGALSGELLCIEREGEARLVAEGLPIPNGVGLSPAGDRLYLVESAWRRIHVFTLDGAGRVAEGRVLVDLSGGHGPDFGYPPRHPTPDGLAVDADGGIWFALAGAGQVWRYTPEGEPDLSLAVPARRVTSIAFGGADSRDAFLTSAESDHPPERGVVLRARAPRAGLVPHPARV